MYLCWRCFRIFIWHTEGVHCPEGAPAFGATHKCKVAAGHVISINKSYNDVIISINITYTKWQIVTSVE